MRPENMPYYCGPQVMSPPNELSSLADATNVADATYSQSLFSSIITDADNKHGHLLNILCILANSLQ